MASKNKRIKNSPTVILPMSSNSISTSYFTPARNAAARDKRYSRII